MGEVISKAFEQFAPLMWIFKAIGIVFLIYILFLILKTLFSMRANARIKSIAKNVEEINKKLDVLTNKRAEKRRDKKK